MTIDLVINMIGVFADEIDMEGNDVTRAWELK
jgi:hypothetical protein